MDVGWDVVYSDSRNHQDDMKQFEKCSRDLKTKPIGGATSLQVYQGFQWSITRYMEFY